MDSETSLRKFFRERTLPGDLKPTYPGGGEDPRSCGAAEAGVMTQLPYSEMARVPRTVGQREEEVEAQGA